MLKEFVERIAAYSGTNPEMLALANEAATILAIPGYPGGKAVVTFAFVIANSESINREGRAVWFREKRVRRIKHDDPNALGGRKGGLLVALEGAFLRNPTGKSTCILDVPSSAVSTIEVI